MGGLNAKDSNEFFDKVKELSNPAKQQYALEPAYINVLNIVNQCLGTPNGWAVNADRSLTHQYETDAYLAGLEFVAKLFAAGAFYPDVNMTNAKTRIVNGSLGAMVVSGPVTWAPSVLWTLTRTWKFLFPSALTGPSSPPTTWVTAQ
ncbi:hypothetical protein NHF46_04750 [Arthrobacter alpinus]|nr:hypothetical protein [Arthrobacter alpinus]